MKHKILFNNMDLTELKHSKKIIAHTKNICNRQEAYHYFIHRVLHKGTLKILV